MRSGCYEARAGRFDVASVGAPSQLAFPVPDVDEVGAFAAEASSLVEIDAIVRAESRVDALERRLESSGPAASAGGSRARASGFSPGVDWRGHEGRHDAPRPGRGGHHRRLARVSSQCGRGLRGRNRQSLRRRHHGRARAVRPRRASPSHPRGRGGSPPERVGNSHGAHGGDGVRRRLGDQLRRGRVLVAARRLAPRRSRRRSSALRDGFGVPARLRPST